VAIAEQVAARARAVAQPAAGRSEAGGGAPGAALRAQLRVEVDAAVEGPRPAVLALRQPVGHQRQRQAVAVQVETAPRPVGAGAECAADGRLQASRRERTVAAVPVPLRGLLQRPRRALRWREFQLRKPTLPARAL